jgi:glucose-6-phosphate isomerase
MRITNKELWARFQRYYTEFPSIQLALDLSRLNFGEDYLSSMETRMQKAFIAMAELEKGGIANKDEKRMVGHYWLRNPALAPTATIRKEIGETRDRITKFAASVHAGDIRGKKGPFKYLLVIGIGGSALGPQFVAHALGGLQKDRMRTFFFDNTDPDGMDRVLDELRTKLGQTLCIVISKSGGTKETRNGMLEAKAAYERAGVSFPAHAVAVTGFGSELDHVATAEGWLARFPMWDWVGGRTSETSAVGLLPAALQGIDTDQLLSGACACDELTRKTDTRKNPAALLALAWFHAVNAKGDKDMVILPYKDRLELFSKYLQQLTMESLGKEKDLDGKVVHQGIAVYGNKGSTDQHAYIQQLRDGVPNFFATFIEVLKDRREPGIEVERGVTSGDYLDGFFLGTRRALFENGRESVTITIRSVSPFSVGVLIALYERAVGLYASLVNINAYHQPGVEAGKKAATEVLDLQGKIQTHIKRNRGSVLSAEELSQAIGSEDNTETVFKICEHLSANPNRGLERIPGDAPSKTRYRSV